MKKSSSKMLIFQIVIFLVLLINSTFSNILRDYNFVFLLLGLLIIFKFIFGFEKDRHRHTKDVLFDVLIFLIIFFMAYYVFGIVIGFARTDNYYSWMGLKTFILPLILFIILKEILRYQMISKCHDDKLLLITTTILFICFDITDAIYYNNFSSAYNTFILIALTILPAITTNIACTYISKNTGYKPVILYLLVTELYLYLLPIVPDPNEYLVSIINLILPLVLLYRLHSFFEKEKDEFQVRSYKKSSAVGMIIPAVIIVFLVYITSGYFKYYAIAVASGSMSPVFDKGDVVVVEKIKDNYGDLKEGDIIAFKYNNVVVIHRIINIIKDDGKYYFYTKGDANNVADNYSVEEEMIVGVVKIWVPYVGLPTVWLNE